MQYLNTVDYILIGGYFCALIFLGFYLQRKASASMEDYFLAGRNLPWWAIGISGLGWSLDITGTMLIVSLLYLLGPRGLFIEFRGGVPLGLVFVMAWTGKWHRRSGCMTGAEWQKFRFGEGFGGKCARLISAVAGIVFTVGMLAYLVKGVGLFISTFIPQLSPWQCSLIMVAVATLYTAASGFYGVVYSDLFQAVLILTGITLVTIVAYSKVTSYETISVLSSEITGTIEWVTSFPQQQAVMPQGYEMYECLFMFTIFLVLRNIVVGLGTGNTPQYFAARSERDCGKIACLWSGLLAVRWPMMMGYAVLGLFLVKNSLPDSSVLLQAADFIQTLMPEVTKSQWPDTLSKIANYPQLYPQIAAGLEEMLGADWQRNLQMISFEGTVNAEKILPAVLLYVIPSGFKGLIVVTLLAASMSTFDSTVNMASALFTRDIYQGFIRPKAANKELLWMTYAFIAVIVVCGFMMGFTADSINDIWGWIMMGLSSGLAAPSILRLYWWRFNGQGFAAGTFGGMFAAIIQRFCWPELPEQWQFVILTSLSLFFSILVTYLTAPAPEDVLENYYRKVRPFGFWKPFTGIISERMQAAMKKEHFNDLVSLPFIFTGMISLYLLPMQLMIHTFTAFAVTLVVFVISIAGILRFWKGNNYSADVLDAESADNDPDTAKVVA